jgi:bifunctional UDP-N-acetylglucosamine pyrophosphorylase/glucosamine-1-phosphate N-acetyltransferase/UDP-N-acetylglucosamine pyrophosphorylase
MNDSANQKLAIVMAAGKGTRMRSDLPKVLVPVCARPMIDYVLDALDEAGIEQTLVVVGYRADDVRAALAGRRGVSFCLQAEQLGTGHAVMMCREHLVGHSGPVLVVAGDSPLLQAESVRKLLAEFAARQPACLLGTGTKDDPTGLGRVLRDSAGRFAGIVEEKDATTSQRQVQEVNLSCYLFRAADLLWALDQLRAENSQREYYLTDCPGLLQRAGRTVDALCVMQPSEALSINTPDELAAVEREMRRQQAAR